MSVWWLVTPVIVVAGLLGVAIAWMLVGTLACVFWNCLPARLHSEMTLEPISQADMAQMSAAWPLVFMMTMVGILYCSFKYLLGAPMRVIARIPAFLTDLPTRIRERVLRRSLERSLPAMRVVITVASPEEDSDMDGHNSDGDYAP